MRTTVKIVMPFFERSWTHFELRENQILRVQLLRSFKDFERAYHARTYYSLSNFWNDNRLSRICHYKISKTRNSVIWEALVVVLSVQHFLLDLGTCITLLTCRQKFSRPSKLTSLTLLKSLNVPLRQLRL